MDRELGYSLHLRTTDLIKDFLRESENHFQYLQEILAEAKEHFARRESVHLLPKTPCTKRKRRRIIKEETSPSPAPSPVELSSCPISPIAADTTLNDSTRPSTRSRKTKTSQTKRSSRPQRKQPRRGAKKASEVEDDATESLSINESKAGTPKRITRSKRKQSEKENDQPDENTNKKKKNVVINDSKPETPQRVTRTSKRKDSVDNKNTTDENRQSTPSPQPKKLRVNQQPLPNTPQNADVFIPETPQIEEKLEEPSPTANCKAQVVRSSLKFVLTPKAKSKEKDEQEVCAYADESVVNGVVVVEAIAYDNNEDDGNTQEKRKSKEQAECSQSSKKLRRETRSSVKGTKRKYENCKEQDKKARLLSPSTNTSDEGYNTERQEDVNAPRVVEEVTTSAETSNQPKQQRRSFRPSQGSRRSSRQCVKRSLNNTRQSNRIRQSRSTVKSSVLLTLSAKKLMPSLERNQNDDSNKDTIKTKLFEEREETQSSDKTEDPNLQLTEQSYKNEDSRPQEKLTTQQVDTLDDTENNEETSACLANINDTCQDELECDKGESQDEDDDKDDVDAVLLETAQRDDDSQDDDEFEDAQESSQDDNDDDHFHDASDNILPEDNNSKTHSLPRNLSSSSDISGGSEDPQSPCKQDDYNCNRSQSSPEPSQENCIQIDDKKNGSDPDNAFGFENKVLKNNAGVVHSFIKRNTPKKVDRQEKTRQMKLAILEKEEKEKERINKLAEQKQKKIEDQKRKREEKERKVAELRAAKTREQREKKAQMEKKLEMRRRLEDKARKVREKEEEAKRKARLEKKAECDARRKLEEEQRLQKLKEKEEEERKHREMLQRKAEFEEQERQRKINEAKRQFDQREQELLRAKEIEKQRALKEMEEKERKAKEEKEKEERKMRENKEKEEKEQKRIAALFREKEEQERKQREKKAREEKLQRERELKFRLEEEAEKEKQRLRKLQEQRAAEEERLQALKKVADNYVMTPPPPPKTQAKSTQDNYNIDDICSDDSTDDEDAPKKIIPQWAQGAKLKAALISQSNVTLTDIEGIFGGVVMPNLDEIFTQKKRKRFYQRTSSAHWDSPPLKPVNRGTLI